MVANSRNTPIRALFHPREQGTTLTFLKKPEEYLARGQDEDKVRGFAFGGDDYLVKPFSTAELITRVKAMLRRWHQYGVSKPAATNQLTPTCFACRLLLGIS